MSLLNNDPSKEKERWRRKVDALLKEKERNIFFGDMRSQQLSLYGRYKSTRMASSTRQALISNTKRKNPVQAHTKYLFKLPQCYKDLEILPKEDDDSRKELENKKVCLLPLGATDLWAWKGEKGKEEEIEQLMYLKVKTARKTLSSKIVPLMYNEERQVQNIFVEPELEVEKAWKELMLQKIFFPESVPFRLPSRITEKNEELISCLQRYGKMDTKVAIMKARSLMEGKKKVIKSKTSFSGKNIEMTYILGSQFMDFDIMPEEEIDKEDRQSVIPECCSYIVSKVSTSKEKDKREMLKEVLMEARYNKVSMLNLLEECEETEDVQICKTTMGMPISVASTVGKMRIKPHGDVKHEVHEVLVMNLNRKLKLFDTNGHEQKFYGTIKGGIRIMVKRVGSKSLTENKIVKMEMTEKFLLCNDKKKMGILFEICYFFRVLEEIRSEYIDDGNVNLKETLKKRWRQNKRYKEFAFHKELGGPKEYESGGITYYINRKVFIKREILVPDLDEKRNLIIDKDLYIWDENQDQYKVCNTLEKRYVRRPIGFHSIKLEKSLRRTEEVLEEFIVTMIKEDCNKYVDCIQNGKFEDKALLGLYLKVKNMNIFDRNSVWTAFCMLSRGESNLSRRLFYSMVCSIDYYEFSEIIKDRNCQVVTPKMKIGDVVIRNFEDGIVSWNKGNFYVGNIPIEVPKDCIPENYTFSSWVKDWNDFKTTEVLSKEEIELKESEGIKYQRVIMKTMGTNIILERSDKIHDLTKSMKLHSEGHLALEVLETIKNFDEDKSGKDSPDGASNVEITVDGTPEEGVDDEEMEPGPSRPKGEEGVRKGVKRKNSALMWMEEIAKQKRKDRQEAIEEMENTIKAAKKALLEEEKNEKNCIGVPSKKIMKVNFVLPENESDIDDYRENENDERDTSSNSEISEEETEEEFEENSSETESL